MQYLCKGTTFNPDLVHILPVLRWYLNDPLQLALVVSYYSDGSHHPLQFACGVSFFSSFKCMAQVLYNIVHSWWSSPASSRTGTVVYTQIDVRICYAQLALCGGALH